MMQEETIKPFDSISSKDEDVIFYIIKNELPQVQALILYHIEPKKAALILSKYDTKTSDDILHRISKLKRIDPFILINIEHLIESKINNREFAYKNGETICEEIISAMKENTNDRNIITG